MKITVRGSVGLLVVALYVFSTGPRLFGAERGAFRDPAPSVYSQHADAPEEKVTVFRVDRPERLSVIIEFHAAPLLASRSRGTQDVRLAAETLDELTTRLEEDLARIERTAPDRIASQATAEGSAIRHRYRMTFAGASATVDRTSLAAIRALPYVRAVHDDGRVEMFLANSVPHIGVPEVRQRYGRRGKGIVVAVIDTGINYKHVALGGGFGPGFKVAGGWDFVGNDADPMDDNGHGTHVAGIVAASSATLTGVAPDATLVAYKVLDQDGGGVQSTVLAGVERAIDPNQDGDPSDRADVVNMSLGGPVTPNDPVIAAVERGAAAGVVFCLAAGNAGVVGALGSPALSPSAITVGASDLEDRVAAFSSGGPVAGTWALKPEIAAPGVRIVSSVLGNRTFAASGTSMAAPHVSGVAALLLEQHPDWTPHDVKAAMVSTAKPIAGRYDRETPVAGRFVAFAGAGRVDALAAMEATIFPSQPAANFGIVRRKDQAWTASATVTLTNRGPSSETLTLQRSTLPGGVKLTVVPESIVLDAGASVELRLSLEVPAALEANDSEVLIAGVLQFTGAKTSLVLPWTILKADVIQVTFTGDDEFQIYVSNGPDPAGLWPAGDRTFVALIPRMLTSDIMILTSPKEGEDPRLIIRERQPVDGLTEIVVSPDEAAYRVTLDAVDERGLPLDRLPTDATGRLWHRFELPSGPLVEIEREEGRALRISNFEEVLFRTYETRLAGTERYFAAYRHLRNVKQDEVLTIRSSDWASQKIRTLCRNPECSVIIGAGLGSFAYFRYYPFPPGTNEFTTHITAAADPRYDFRAYVIAREKGFVFDPTRATNPWTFISNSLRNVDGRFSTSPFGRVSAAEYFPPDRHTPLVLGDGPSVMRTAVGAWFVYVQPHGPAGELFGSDDARDVDVKIERLDGAVIIYPESRSLYGMRPTPGIYRLTVTDEYKVSGQPGRLTQTSNYDMTAKPDGPPSLSSLRVENGYGVATTTVSSRSASRLLFAARQSVMSGQGSWMVKHSRLDAAATQAWWRRHGTTEWLPLSVTNTGEDYSYKGEFPGSPGTLYAASLAPATAMEGAVDLKFSLRNLTGGTTEVVYEPAFMVGPPLPPRRRAMR